MYQSKEKNTEGAITAMGVAGNMERKKKARFLLNEEPGLHEISSVVELFYNSQRKPEQPWRACPWPSLTSSGFQGDRGLWHSRR